ncbi:MAG TPA: lytic transglycosylase domain-containing protein [Paracoccaceae bacterium]
MQTFSRRAALALIVAGLAGCGRRERAGATRSTSGLHTNETPELRRLIDRYSAEYQVPAGLVHRVVQRESGYRPEARNGPYYGLMQILPQTARTMGYHGSAQGLLNAETNLKYGVKYLRGAWLLSNGSHDRAVMWYAKGYYYEAKRRGMLVETGLRA